MASKQKTKSNGASTAAAAIEHSPIAAPTGSTFEAGKGANRKGKRFIVLYGAPKSRKTTAVSKLHGRRVKWLISDSNCIPTLEAMGRLPHPDDTYEITNISEAKALIQKMVDHAIAVGPENLGFDILALDSLTAFFDWAKDEVARLTSQRFLGDNKDNNGWNQMNAEFGKLLDLLAELSQYVTVIALAHATPPPGDDKARTAFKRKGNWGGLSLSPQIAERAARLANWLLFQTIESRYVDDSPENRESDAFIQAEVLPEGTIKHTEVLIHTTPVDLYSASANSRLVNGKPVLEAEEPGDLDYILVKEGLLPAREA